MEQRISTGCARIFYGKDREMAEAFFRVIGQREDVSSCIIYFDRVIKKIVVEWTFKKN